MFGRGEPYNFSDKVRHALVGAREIARSLNHDHVSPEHLLLSLVQDMYENGAALLLDRLQVPRAELERELRGRVLPGPAETPVPRDPPYTSRGKKVLELALKEARSLGAGYVGTPHLLLGIIAEGKCLAAQMLTHRFGVELERARALAGEEGQGPPSDTANLILTLKDHSDLSIYEQLIAQLQEASATGELKPGDRLPAVRQLADRLDIAPGTVARAYAELERRGLVVTGGARGTRVAGRKEAAEPQRFEALVAQLRPVAVSAYHMGATAQDLRQALDRAMEGIYRDG